MRWKLWNNNQIKPNNPEKQARRLKRKEGEKEENQRD